MPSAFALQDELVAAGATLLHPFDDPVVIAAQGTVGLEFADGRARRSPTCWSASAAVG